MFGAIIVLTSPLAIPSPLPSPSSTGGLGITGVQPWAEGVLALVGVVSLFVTFFLALSTRAMAVAMKKELGLLELERIENRDREQPQLECRVDRFGDRDAEVKVDFVDGSRPAMHLAVLLQGRGNWYHGSRPGALYPSQRAPNILAHPSAPSTTITGTFPEWEADQLMDGGCWAGVAWTGSDGKRRRWGSKFDQTLRPIGEPLTGVTAG